MKTGQMCLSQLFQEQVKQTPDAVAVVDGDRVMTYAELDRVTDRLAGWLQNQGVWFDRSAGIFMETCLEYIVTYINAKLERLLTNCLFAQGKPNDSPHLSHYQCSLYSNCGRPACDAERKSAAG